MRKMILGVIIVSLFLIAFSGVSARGDNNDFNDDYVIFTVGRSVFSGNFERSPHNGEVLYPDEDWPFMIQSITFTKVFARNKSTGETELLFEMRMLFDAKANNRWTQFADYVDHFEIVSWQDFVSWQVEKTPEEINSINKGHAMTDANKAMTNYSKEREHLMEDDRVYRVTEYIK